VVENGAIGESGQHDALLAQGNRYACFYEATFAKPEAGCSQTVAPETPAH
jgi:hypothetical protein